MSLAAKANHLTENLVGIRASSHARNGNISQTSNLLTHQRHQSLITSMGNQIKESEFQNLSLSNRLSTSKKVFNANSQTDILDHIQPSSPQTIQHKSKHTERRKSYNLISGVPLQDKYQSNKFSHARKTLLPPQKRYDSLSSPKAEYRNNLSSQPRTFFRQNGDFTHFQDMKVQNSLISSKNMTPSLFKS